MLKILWHHFICINNPWKTLMSVKKKLCLYFCMLPDHKERQANVMLNIRKLYGQPGFREIDIRMFMAYTPKDQVQNISKYISDEMLEKEQVKKYPNKVYCAISHAKIWEEFHDSEYEHMVILEDDARIRDNFIDNVFSILGELQSYDSCALWSHPHFKRNIDQEFRTVSKNYQKYGALATLISQPGVEKLLASLPFTNNPDMHIGLLNEKSNLNSYVSNLDLVENIGAIDCDDSDSQLGSTIFNLPQNRIKRVDDD